MVLSMLTMVVAMNPVQPVAEAVLAQQKIQIIRWKKSTPAQLQAKNEAAKPQAESDAKRSAELDARAAELDAKAQQLDAQAQAAEQKQAAADEQKKQKDAERLKAVQKKAEQLGSQVRREYGNAADALAGEE